MMGEGGRCQTQGTNKEKLAENRNTGQFWKGRKISPGSSSFEIECQKQHQVNGREKETWNKRCKSNRHSN